MTMSWNSYTQNVCIITPAWHIRSSQGFVLSMLVILGISVAYEYLKWVMRCLDVAIVRLEDAQSTIGPRGTSDSEADLLSTTASLRRPRTRNAKRIIPMTYSDLVANDTAERGDDTGSSSPKRGAKPTSCALLRLLPLGLQTPSRLHSVRSLLYGLQVSIACFLMLVMMTYNSWMIGAIVAGAILGAFLYSRAPIGAAVALDDKSTACH